MSNMIRIDFRQLDDPQLWDLTTPGVSLTSVSIGPQSSAGRLLTITGVTREIPAFDVVAESDAGTTTQAVTLQAGQRIFEAPLTVSAGARSCALLARNATTEFDRVALRLDAARAVDLADGRQAGLGAHRIGFAAGVPDRIVERRSVSLLYRPPGLIMPGGWLRPDNMVIVDPNRWAKANDIFVTEKPVDPSIPGFKPPIGGRIVDLTKLAAAVLPVIDQLNQAFSRDAANPAANFDALLISLQAKRRRLVLQAVKAAAGTVSDDLRRKAQNAVNVALGSAGQSRKFAPTSLRLAFPQVEQQLRSNMGMLFSGGSWLLITSQLVAEDDIATWIDFLVRRAEQFGRVGVIFSDRLRFQPAGLVVGEPLYTLALTPGEEVQVRQTVETKRKATSEDTLTREQERELTLSSTWSTDISQAVTNTTTLQMTGSIFGSETIGPFADLPLSGNMGTSGSASAANTLTTTRAVKLNQQLSGQAAAKIRGEHKTRIEITSEQASSLSTTRTIRNLNQQRSATHLFWKVYRKERVTLERYDAHLCLRLVVDDPGAALRARFLKRLSEMANATLPPATPDPDTPPTSPDPSESNRLITEKSYQAPRDQEVEVIYGFILYEVNPEGMYGSSINITLNGVGNEFALASIPEIIVDSFRVEDTGRERIPEGQRTWSGPGANEEFLHYGSFDWHTPPTLGVSASTDGVLYVLQKRTIHYMTSGRAPNPVENDPGELPRPAAVGWREVNFRLVCTWDRKDPIVIGAGATSDPEQLAPRPITREAVMALRDTIIADYRGAVVAAAAASCLRFPANQQLSQVRSMLAFEEASLEQVPYWASEDGRRRRSELEATLADLPIEMSIDELISPELTAAQAILFVPIHAGYERQALRLVDNLTPADIEFFVDQIETFRQSHFAPTGGALPAFAEVTGPQPPLSTSIGQTSWANDWEKSPQKFDVLAAWQEFAPTDGVHVEVMLSDTVATDEQRVSVLERQSTEP